MKHYLVILTLVLAATAAQAQVGIGTSSQLVQVCIS